MKGRAPAFQLYADDFLAETALMAAEEVGIYARLLAFDWRNDGFALQPAQLARLTGTTPDRFAQAWETLSALFVARDGRHTSPHLEAEREKHRQWREKSATGGRRSAQVRAARKGGSTTVEEDGSDGSATVEPPYQPAVNTSYSELRTPDSVDSTTTRASAADSDDGLADRFAEPRHRDAYFGLRRAAQNPRSLDYEVLLVAEGGERPGAGAQRAYGWEVVGEALHQISVNGGRATPRALQTFCEGVLSVGVPAPRDGSGGGVQDRARLWLVVAREFDLLAFTGNREQYEAKRDRARASGKLGDAFDAEWERVRLWDRIGSLSEHLALLEITKRLGDAVAGGRGSWDPLVGRARALLILVRRYGLMSFTPGVRGEIQRKLELAKADADAWPELEDDILRVRPWEKLDTLGADRWIEAEIVRRLHATAGAPAAAIKRRTETEGAAVVELPVITGPSVVGAAAPAMQGVA